MSSDFVPQMNLAIKQGDADQVAALIGDDETKLTKTTVFGTWLQVASMHGQLGVARRLVEMGIDVNAHGGIADATAMHDAACKGHVDIIQYLLSCGAEFDVSKPERNPLFATIYNGHPQVAALLIRSGLDPHVTYDGANGKPKNALSYAKERSQNEIIELLEAAGCTLPVDQSAALNEATHQHLLAAMTAEFGEVSELALREIVPVYDDLHIAVHVIRPNETHRCITLFTTGMSDLPMTVPDGQQDHRHAELLIHLPASWPLPLEADSTDEVCWPVSWLQQIAYFPHEADTWLGGRHTIISNDEPPIPFAANTKQSCMLLIADFANWSPLKISDDKTVHFYTLIPIYAEERDVEVEFGVAELLRRFEQHSVTTVVDVSRVNVAEVE